MYNKTKEGSLDWSWLVYELSLKQVIEGKMDGKKRNKT